MEAENHVDPVRVMFLYWGRRGLSRFALDAARAAHTNPKMVACLSVSRQNESFSAFTAFEGTLVPIDTFATNMGAMAQAWRIPLIRRQLAKYVAENRIGVVIELLPHVWSPLILPAIRSAGARYVTIIHDADPHPGDATSVVKFILDQVMHTADHVVTLSDAVACRIATSRRIPSSKMFTLFLPDFDFGATRVCRAPMPGEALKIAFLGRIMPYKGLPLFIDTIELLRREGIAVEAGVFGEGALGGNEARLTNLGVEVVNRWLTDVEIGAILPRFHALMLTHTEASQSGIAAAAFGAGLPVIASPVGGLVEQVKDGINGMLATSTDAPAMAVAVKRLLQDPRLYDQVCRNLHDARADRSMARFVDECVAQAVRKRTDIDH